MGVGSLKLCGLWDGEVVKDTPSHMQLEQRFVSQVVEK